MDLLPHNKMQPCDPTQIGARYICTLALYLQARCQSALSVATTAARAPSCVSHGHLCPVERPSAAPIEPTRSVAHNDRRSSAHPL